jgi:hypothetical protein
MTSRASRRLMRCRLRAARLALRLCLLLLASLRPPRRLSCPCGRYASTLYKTRMIIIIITNDYTFSVQWTRYMQDIALQWSIVSGCSKDITDYSASCQCIDQLCLMLFPCSEPVFASHVLSARGRIWERCVLLHEGTMHGCQLRVFYPG